jgi:hypothetical protein
MNPEADPLSEWASAGATPSRKNRRMNSEMQAAGLMASECLDLQKGVKGRGLSRAVIMGPRIDLSSKFKSLTKETEERNEGSASQERM